MIGYSPGHMAMQREFGTLTCPHCGETATKGHPKQLICTKAACKRAQARKKAKENR